MPAISLDNLSRFKGKLVQLIKNDYGVIVAQLVNGTVPVSQLPSSVFNVQEYEAFSEFPETGATNIIYIDATTNASYRWDAENNEYASLSTQDSVKFVAQTLTTEQKSQARTNIDAASPSDIPTNVVHYSSQSLTPEEKSQARTNIGAAAEGDIPTGVVLYTAQSLTPEQKTQARTNIGAASSSDVSNLDSAVTDLESDIAAFTQGEGGFVKTVTKTDNGFDVIYSDERDPVSITLESGGLDFNGGVVRKVNDKYYLYLQKDYVDLPAAEFVPIEIPASGGGGGGTTITLSNVVWVRYVRNGKDAVFSFNATCSDASSMLTVEWYVNSVSRGTQIGNSGDNFSFNAKQFLSPSTNNTVMVTITASDGTSTSRTWTVTTTAFEVSWASSIKPIMLYTRNNNVSVGVKVTAEADAENNVKLSLNGHNATRVVRSSTSITFSVDSSWFNVGANTVTVGMASATNPDDKADDITFVAIWAVGAENPIVAFANPIEDGVQYEQMGINYFVYDPDNEVADCSIQVGSEEPRPQHADRTMQTFQYISYEVKSVTMTLRCGGSSATTIVNIAKSEHDLGYINTEELVYNVDPVGHSNTDADRDQFGGFVFSNNFDWINGGFKLDENNNTAFVVKKGNTVTLPRSLFQDEDATGKTIDLSFKVTNSNRYNAVAMQELNNGSNTGVILRANSGELRISNTTGKEFRYCEESRIDMSVLVEEETNNRLVTIWFDGIPSNVSKYAAGMLVQDEGRLVIGSPYCDVWVYAIRVYNVALSKKQMIQNYVSEGNTTEEKSARYDQNTIIDSNDRISIDDLRKASANLTIVKIETTRMTTSKSDPVPAHVTIIDGMTELDLPAASAPDAEDGTLYKVQGTSSAAYGRSSYNLDIDFKGTGKKYKLTEDAIAVNYINIKVNVASSENANNINAVDWYNTFQPYLTEPRNRPGVRDTCQGKPCAVFITNTDSVPVWFSSQLVNPGETVLYAMGDICNSKKNKAVFGQDGKTDEYVTHPTKACIEVSGNDTEPERFRSTEAVFNPDADDGKGRWETVEGGKTIKHFEWRMNPSGKYINPDTQEIDTSSEIYQVVTSWNNTVAWVVSTIDNPTKFKNEVGNYFAIDSLLYHFLFIEYFEGYDNVSKNTFYSYDWDETAQKYLWNIKCAYDMDTILAADNDGIPFGDYGIDFTDTMDGTPSGRRYFNAPTNTIWNNILQAYQSELSRMYISLRGNGAWDSDAMAAKWNTYQNKRPRAAMILDAYNKYIKPWKTVISAEEQNDDSYLPRMQGSKIYWRKQFLTYQTSYMDGKYGYYTKAKAINFRTNVADSSTQDFTIQAYAKTYITILTDDNRSGVQKIGTGDEYTFENISVGSNSTMYVTPDRLVQFIHPLNETQNSTFSASGAAKLNDVILGGEIVNTSWDAGSSIDVPSVLLKDLSVRNIVNYSSNMDLSTNVELETLDTRGTSTGQITLPSYAPLTSIQLNACTGIKALNLLNVETFSMESSEVGSDDGGRNLVSIYVEGCNNYMTNTAMQRYVAHAANASSAATRRIRMTDVSWSFGTVNELYKIATKWKGYNSIGETQDAPVLTGSVHVQSMAESKLPAIRAVWPETTLTITYDSTIPTYDVDFKDDEGNAILDKTGEPYVQRIDSGDSAYDPLLTVPPEIDTPTRIDPEGEYRYTFTGWSNLDGAVYADKTVVANFSKEKILYNVRWWRRLGDESPLKVLEGIAYGSEAVYQDETHPFPPTKTDEEEANFFSVFKGWDKSTGFIRGNTDVYAIWDRATFPASGTELKDMSIAQIYGMAKKNMFDNYVEEKDYIDVKVGRDYNFSNVESEVLVENRYFNGSEILRLNNVKLFDENSPNFTIAIDYEYCDTTSNMVLISSSKVGSSEGFKVSYYGDSSQSENSQSVRLSWGDRTDTISHGLTRGILVLRHRKGSKNLYIASDNGGRRMVHTGPNYGEDTLPPNTWDAYRFDGYNSTIHYLEIARTQETSTDACLCFGADPNGPNGMMYPAKGWIHWCKIWYDDLGITTVKELASWPRETWRLQYAGSNRYGRADDVGGTTGATFILSHPLSQCYEFYPSNVEYVYGDWTNSSIRTFVNTRCLNALPVEWQAVISPVHIATMKYNNDAQEIYENTVDKLYLPSVIDLRQVDGKYSNEGRLIGWFTSNDKRVKFAGIKTNEKAPFTTLDDPTLFPETYTVEEGDIWIRTVSSTNTAYVYVSADTAAKHGWYGGRSTADTYNNITATGTQGGLWMKAKTYFTRSISSINNYFVAFPTYGTSETAIVVPSVNFQYNNYRNRYIVFMFSI